MNPAELLRRKRGLVFAVPAGALAVLVLVAALNFDQGATAKHESKLKDAQQILAPRAATAEELKSAPGSLSEQTAIRLADGAWVQVADENGKLSQQYSAARLEPLAASKLRMTEPRARMFMKDGRVLSMSARSGLVHVPRRALESGALDGEVEIRLFKPSEGREVDVLRDKPGITISAEEAQFDGVAGEVRCERAVRIETEAGSFAGEGLTLVLDSSGEGVERLIVDRALEPIRIDRAARAVAAKRREARAPVANELVDVGAAGAAPPPKEPEAPRFYHLVLTGGVEVVRTRAGIASIVRGERIDATFSLESEGLDRFAAIPAPADVRRLPGMPALAVGALAFAAQPEHQDREPQDLAQQAGGASDSVVVSFGGRLELVPVTNQSEMPASRDEIRFEVSGQQVELVDGRSKTTVTCSRLRYDVLEERVLAEGREGVPLVVANARMRLEAGRFSAHLSQGIGRLEGPGRMAFSRGTARAAAWLELAPAATADIARALVSSDPDAAALVVARPRDRAVEEELAIQWAGGVDLRFTGGSENTKLAGARFDRQVRVGGRQFDLDAQSLEVMFSPDDAERVDAIIADGGTRVQQRGAAGAMSAERIELYLGANAKGDSVPTKLVARKGVDARDAKQAILTDDLIVGFAERKSDGAAAGDPAMQSLGDVEVDQVEAHGGVQVLLAGREGAGARVFAQDLTGNAVERRVRLTGENVAIVRANIIADNLRDLRFDDATHTATSAGAGRLRAFKDALVVGEGVAQRPDPKDPTTLDGSWTDGLSYTEPSPEKSVVEIKGSVVMRSRPSELATDALDAQSVVIGIGAEPAKKGGGSERALESFLARGAARIESRAWTNAAHEGEPRVFRITGEHIEYDMRSRQGAVVGAGALFVNMPPDAAKPAAAEAGPIRVGATGSTRFTWTKGMALERVVGEQFRIRMDDGVELLHAGANDSDSLSLRCATLEALVSRPVAEGDAKKGVDLGGPAELLGFKGAGGVFVRTPAQDLECGEIEYSVQTGIAILRAAEGRSVTVVFTDKPTPLQAKEIEWDLRNGRIEIKKPLVTGGR